MLLFFAQFSGMKGGVAGGGGVARLDITFPSLEVNGMKEGNVDLLLPKCIKSQVSSLK